LPLPERALEDAADQQPARAAAQGSAQEDQGGRAVPERGERAAPGNGTAATHPRELAGAALPGHAAALRVGTEQGGSGGRRLSKAATPTPDPFTQKGLRYRSLPRRAACPTTALGYPPPARAVLDEGMRCRDPNGVLSPVDLLARPFRHVCSLCYATGSASKSRAHPSLRLLGVHTHRNRLTQAGAPWEARSSWEIGRFGIRR